VEGSIQEGSFLTDVMDVLWDEKDLLFVTKYEFPYCEMYTRVICLCTSIEGRTQIENV
jgi:hypothetical protein